MRCTSPSTVGFNADGKTLCWSPKRYSKEYAPFQIPCGKCIACRLENARQTAVRCVHEASMYEKNSFVTLTYSEENLKSTKLQYKDFQKFVKALRTHIQDEHLKRMYPDVKTRELRRALHKERNKSNEQNNGNDPLHGTHSSRISIFCAGEYGDKKKRPHWHALIFNWRPSDLVHKYTNHRGDKVFDSALLASLWTQGISEVGSVTFESAGYCARYASKKLSHGKDKTHDYEPISRRSSKYAIGKTWLEKNWRDVFTHGYIILPGGIKTGVPRYYEKWLKKTHPTEWNHYVTQTKNKIVREAIIKEAKTSLEEKKINQKRSGLKGLQIKRERVRQVILEQKHNQLLKYLKDI